MPDTDHFGPNAGLRPPPARRFRAGTTGKPAMVFPVLLAWGLVVTMAGYAGGIPTEAKEKTDA